MNAADLMVLAAGRDVQKLAVTVQLVAVRRYFALSDRGAESPGRTQDHATLGGLTQPAARRAGGDERLNQNAHCSIGGIDIVGRHVPQGARGPQRSPAGTDRGNKVGLAFDAEKTFKLAREARSEPILDERGRAHHGQRAGTVLHLPPRREQLVEHRGCDGLIQESQFHGERMPAGLSAVLRREHTTCVGFETERPDLRAIGLGVDTETAGSRQTGLTETGRDWPPWGRNRPASLASPAVIGNTN